MNLAQQQEAFMAQVLEEGHALPAAWTPRHAAGMEIYRNAYRARLVDALRDTYPRTAKWVGEDAFRRAAAHHIITHPPGSWTLDVVGEGFPSILRALFPGDREVAELGWLEWAMHCCFTAADMQPLDAAGFSAATASFHDRDWADMCLSFLPGTDQLAVDYDVGKLWRALGQDNPDDVDCTASEPSHCVVWREGLKPVFIHIDLAEGTALSMMRGGATYGEACAWLIAQLGEAEAAPRAGAMLGRWLHHGMIAGVSK